MLNRINDLTHMNPCLLSRWSQVRVLPRLPLPSAPNHHNQKSLPAISKGQRVAAGAPKTGQMLAVLDRSGPHEKKQAGFWTVADPDLFALSSPNVGSGGLR